MSNSLDSQTQQGTDPNLLSEQTRTNAENIIRHAGNSSNRPQFLECLQEIILSSIVDDKISIGDVEATLKYALDISGENNALLTSSLIDIFWLFDNELENLCLPNDSQKSREKLNYLANSLKSSLSKETLLSRLDSKFLETINLTSNGDLLNRKIARTNTSLLYRQKKFNLLREENEGYSKLMVELIDGLNCFHSNSLDAHILSQHINERIKTIIGSFDLDPNKVLDTILTIFSSNIVYGWKFFLKLLRDSPWKPESQKKFWKDMSYDEQEKELGTFVCEEENLSFSSTFSGKKNTMAQILGHDLQYLYNEKEFTDDSICYLIAILIKYGFFGLDNIWPHLSPSDDEMSKEWDQYKEKIDDLSFKAKGNALTMAAPLPDEESETGETASIASETPQEPTKPKVSQKIGLLKALLAVGELKTSLVILGRYPFVLRAFPDVANLYHKLLHVSFAPVYSSFSPQKDLSDEIRERLKQPKYVPTDVRLREITLRPPDKKTIVYGIDPFGHREDRTQQEVFFYEDFKAENLPILRTLDNFNQIGIPWLKLSGIALHYDPSLVIKLCRIARGFVSKSTQGQDLWLDIIRVILLPVSSLVGVNIDLSNELYNLLTLYDPSTRYALYGEWSSTTIKKYPEMKLQVINTEREAKGILRRLTKTNVKQTGRLLAKVCHPNPYPVFSIALNQIETYDNLVEVIVDSARFMTALDFDVLTFAILSSFSNEMKKRLKPDGTSIAHWLQGLASFCGRVFRKYPNLDCTFIVEYVIKQLKLNQMFDLKVLKELLSQMTGLQPWTNLSDTQLQGAAGGPFLREISLSLIYENKDSLKKCFSHLFTTLRRNRLVTQLVILLAQKFSSSIYDVTDDNSHLKLVSALYDDCCDVLYLLMEFLNITCGKREYYELLPSFDELVKEYHIQPHVAFFILRYRHLKPDTATMNEYADDTMDIDSDANGITNTEDSTMTDFPVETSSIVDLLPENVWECINPDLYESFWKFSIYDIYVPLERYENESNRAFEQFRQIEASGQPYSKQKQDCQKLMYLSENLRKELKEHIQSLESIRKGLQNKCTKWFLPMDTQQLRPRGLASKYIWSYCIAPRLRMGPLDALYCAKFIKLLHSLNTPNFSTISFLNKLFDSHLPSFIFALTPRESDSFSRFLFEILSDVTNWYEDKNAYEKECLGNGSLTGFRVDWLDENNHSLLPHSKFILLVSKWHKQLTQYFEHCLLSGEYMHIYNAIIILEKLLPCFPLIQESGQSLKKAAEKLKENEKREDIKILALGYFAKLCKKETTWVSFNTFSGTVKPKDLTAVTEKHTSADIVSKSQGPDNTITGASNLNASAAEFVPKAENRQTKSPIAGNMASVVTDQNEKKPTNDTGFDETVRPAVLEKSSATESPEGVRSQRSKTSQSEEFKRKERERERRFRGTYTRNIEKPQSRGPQENERNSSRYTKRDPPKRETRPEDENRGDRWRSTSSQNRNARSNESQKRTEANTDESSDFGRFKTRDDDDREARHQTSSRSNRNGKNNRSNDRNDSGPRGSSQSSERQARSAHTPVSGHSDEGRKDEQRNIGSNRRMRQDERRERDSRLQKERQRDRPSMRSGRDEKRRRFQ
ncbi:THO complex subunit Tho2 [Schizosaccharomyces cryophilus OY26]|uniref:THO complex subunit 2 n=1 Tax=Schizosaccharomyces cryophilus (strain OY26 / ATCC MYA-4695 / CBS 11777 / NBRC 106824 / NRRL Y48691) TaxID=653667 RepID=S9W8K1_SCHCR|nr:THO complex subunit Tho2 [Schizosaccharomyces cryophilus OY26]EPY54210.1 THO complex subunit Tho2 [Schizosaccharomyces cryophilus OY26]